MYLINKHPDAVTYTTVIDALGKKDKMEEATELIMNMLSKGVVPTRVTYRIVIHRYCQIGKVDDLLKLLDMMLPRQEFRRAYNLVIEKLCTFGNLEEADKLLGKVLKASSKIDANTCHVLTGSYLNKGISLSAYKLSPLRLVCSDDKALSSFTTKFRIFLLDLKAQMLRFTKEVSYNRGAMIIILEYASQYRADLSL
ncbi:Pentatricopeptide repeat-containing protein family [Quillaja saponaria]|uniref:Pentatricopeptide repeat-containing protein family n=1 Tax=Quillaja saponaria TaxID=32244 RepID=A0AAD7KXF3_QUISA|nr:Pentatricopeptide repeat-containing protein family [Quillaja saponaria]